MSSSLWLHRSLETVSLNIDSRFSSFIFFMVNFLFASRVSLFLASRLSYCSLVRFGNIEILYCNVELRNGILQVCCQLSTFSFLDSIFLTSLEIYIHFIYLQKGSHLVVHVAYIVNSNIIRLHWLTILK